MLGLSESTIRRQIRDHMFPIRRIGRSVRVDMSALRPLTDQEVEREGLPRANANGHASVIEWQDSLSFGLVIPPTSATR